MDESRPPIINGNYQMINAIMQFINTSECKTPGPANNLNAVQQSKKKTSYVLPNHDVKKRNSEFSLGSIATQVLRVPVTTTDAHVAV